MKLGSTYHWLCMWLHCWWPWVCPIKTYSTAWLIMNFPRVQAIPLGIIPRVASPFVAPAKISPEKVSPTIRAGAILDLENPLGIKRIRGFSQEWDYGGKKAPTPLYFHLALRSPGGKKYLELLRNQEVSEATISSLQYFSRYLSSQELSVCSSAHIETT